MKSKVGAKVYRAMQRIDRQIDRIDRRTEMGKVWEDEIIPVLAADGSRLWKDLGLDKR